MSIRSFLLNLLFATFLFLTTKYFIGNYYEVYDFMFPVLYSGKITDGITGNVFYPIAHIGLANVYGALYSRLPDIPWYDLAMSGLLIFSTTVIFIAVQIIFRGLIMYQLAIIKAAAFVLLISDSIVNWNYTRFALLLCAAGFVLHTATSLSGENKRGLSLPIFCSFLFAVGCLIRPEAGSLACVVIFAWGVCRIGLNKDLLRNFVPFLLPALIVSGGITIDRKTSEEFYKQLAPFTEAQIALGNITGIEMMKTPEDSMKYVALRAGLVNDPSFISYEFVHSVVRSKNPFSWDISRMERAREKMTRNATSNLPTVIFSVLLFLAGMYLFALLNGNFIKCFFFNLAFWALIFLIAYLMTMENRLFYPLLIFNAAGNLFFMHGNKPVAQRIGSGVFKAAAVLLTLVLSGVALGRQFETSRTYVEKIKVNRDYYDQLKISASGKLLASDGYAFMVIFFNNALPFENFDFSVYKKLLLVDFESSSLTPPYRAFLDRNCQCNSTNLGEVFDYFHRNKDNFIFAGNPERVALFQSYLQIVHKRKYSFQKLTEIIPSSGSSDEGHEAISTFVFQ